MNRETTSSAVDKTGRVSDATPVRAQRVLSAGLRGLLILGWVGGLALWGWPSGWAQDSATVSIANVSVPEGQAINVKMSIGGITGVGLSDFQGRLNYDSEVARVTRIEGLNGYTVFASKLDTPGEARFVVAKTNDPFLQSGDVLQFTFAATGRVNDSTNLNLSLTTFNDRNGAAIPHDINNGRLTVIAQQPLRASFTVDPADPFVDEPVQFRDTTAPPQGGSIQSRSWDFGDGTTSNERNPTHAYTDTGTFTVTLTVVDSFGQSDSESRQVEVSTAVTEGDVETHTFPQPARTRVTFVYHLPRGAESAALTVFSAKGWRVLEAELNANESERAWNLTDGDGEPVPNGVYGYVIVARDADGALVGRSPTGKLVVQR